MAEIIDRIRAALEQRYRVERPLGAGGTALVFLATDLKHGRRVAIKVLRIEIAASVGPDRFLREIEIAARLQHPNILPVYDSGSADGLLYYLMPYVEGESLADRLRRGGPLPVGDATRIAREVASALDYAHRQGVVHRDIKPANILLADEHAIVADFGIARAVTAAGKGTTQAGLALGTPAYMSPEQALGDVNETDGRSDIYSLGCVLYQMLTGRVPFDGPTYQAILASALAGALPDVAALRPDVPAAVNAALRRALARSPDERFATAADFAAALERPDAARPRRWRVRAAAAAALIVATAAAVAWWVRPRALRSAVAEEAEVIAVLPFATPGGAADLLGEGMVDLLSTNLNGVGGIRTVDPRAVIRAWRAQPGGPPDLSGSLAVGRGLDAGSVLVGSVVAAGSRVRLSAALHSVVGGELAQAAAEGPAESILALVDTLSLRLVRDIWRSRAPVPAFRVSAVTTGSLDAVRAYLRGEQAYRRSQWDSAAAWYERAVQLDSAFALAHLRAAATYGWTDGHGAPRAHEATAQANRYAERLPPRDRSLAAAERLFDIGSLAGVDSMRAYVARYPEDAEGWHLLADFQYHAQPVLALSLADLLAPFDQALAIDSSYTPALIHPIELGLLFRDSALFFSYLERLEAGPEAQYTETYRLLGDVTWRGRPIGADDVRRLFAVNHPTALWRLQGAALIAGPEQTDSLIAALAAVWRELPRAMRPRAQALLATRVAALLATGRARAARHVLDTLGTVDPRAALSMSLAALLSGFPGWPGMDAEIAALRRATTNRLEIARWEMVHALSRGDAARGARAVQGIDTADVPARLRGMARAMSGWLAIVQGDTTRGLASMREGIEGGGFAPGLAFEASPMRYVFAATLAARPDTRAEGLRRLHNDWYLSGYLIPYRTAQRLETAGDAAAAAAFYNHFLRLWADADPDLRPIVEGARTALRRLAADQ